MKELDVTTTSVSFEKNLAYATVAIHPKTDPNVNHGMSMKYTLEARDGKWVVLNAGGSKPAARPAGAAGSMLPSGHPPIDSGMIPNPHGEANDLDGAKGRTR